MIAIMEATDSFKHLRLALLRISSEQILSEIFVFVIVRAAALMALLISSVTVIPYLSLVGEMPRQQGSEKKNVF